MPLLSAPRQHLPHRRRLPLARETAEKLSGMRKVVAQRILQSHTEIPPVTQNTRVDVTELMMFRKMLQSEDG